MGTWAHGHMGTWAYGFGYSHQPYIFYQIIVIISISKYLKSGGILCRKINIHLLQLMQNIYIQI